jgi:phosphoglycerate dehydrogenase-like enzyme
VSADLAAWGDLGLDRLRAADADVRFLPPDDGVLTAAHVDGCDAVLFAAPAVTAETVSGPHPPRHLARFGVGLDTVDVAACTRAGVAVTVTPDGARRAVATAALTLVLAVLQRVREKDARVRAGDWSDRSGLLGRGLTGRTVLVVGFGSVAAEFCRLTAPFATVNLAHTRRREVPRGPGDPDVERVALAEGLRRADVVVVTAPLTPQTHHLLDAAVLAHLRPGAVLVNVARGPVVDTAALLDALRDGRLAGAGLDVFEDEPLPADHPLTTFPNVVLAPHCLAWTDELALGNGSSAVTSILALRAGEPVGNLVDPAVLEVAS